MAKKKESAPPISLGMLESITSITRAIALGDLSGQEAFQEILQLASKITGADVASFHVLDTENHKLFVTTTLGPDVWETPTGTAIGITGYVAKEGKPIIINDIGLDSHYVKWAGQTQSELAVPILAEGKVLGVLNVESSHVNKFDEESLQIVQIVASLLATTLKKEELDRARKELETVKHIDTSKDKAFVLTPFREPFNKYYRSIIRPAIEETNLLSVRVDEMFGPTSISQDIWDNINNAKVIVAELTARNPNVMYELGLSHGIGKPVIMMSQSIDDVPFDIKHLRCILYDTTDPDWALILKSSIVDSIRSVLAGKGYSSPYHKKQD